MDISTLFKLLREQASKNGRVSLDAEILSAAEAAFIQNAFGLQKGQYLTIDGVKDADITLAGDTVKMSAGTLDAFNRQALEVKAAFTAGAQVDFVLSIAMPQSWSFGDSFDDLKVFPFGLLALSKSYFIYSTKPVKDYPLWSGQTGDAVDLIHGLNFAAELSVEKLSVMALLLGELTPREPLKLWGSFEAAKPKALPVMSLDADLHIASFELLKGLTVTGLRLTARITEPGPNSIQDVVVGVKATTKDLELLVGFTENATAVAVSGRPLPTYSPTLETLAECTLGAAVLPKGTNFSSFLPEPLSGAFASIQFNGFDMGVSLMPAVKVTSLGFSVGEKHGSSINLGLFDLTGFTLNAAWADPLSANASTMIGLTAQAKMPVTVFPDPFDFSISISKTKSWAVNSVEASYQGAVKLSDIIKEIAPAGTVVPAELESLTFSDFMVQADPSGESFACSCGGAFDCVILSQPFESSFSLKIEGKKANKVTDYTFDLSAGFNVGDSDFLLVAELKSGGSTDFQFTAKADEIPLSDLIVKLFKDFDLDLSGLPDVVLSEVTISYNTPIADEVGIDAAFTFADTGYKGEFTLVAKKKAAWEFVAAAGIGGADPIDIGSHLPLIGKEFAGEFELKRSYLIIASEQSASISLPQYPNLVVPPGVSFAFDLLLAKHPVPLMLPLVSFAPPGGKSLTVHGRPAVGAASEPNAAAAPGTISVQKKIGPVFIESIGIGYENQILSCSLNASITVGPLSASMNGLSFGSSLTAFKPSFNLHGLGVSYSEPPLTIAGEFVNLTPAGADYIQLEGCLVIGTGEFTVTVFGYYGDESGFNSMFIFGDVAYDFGGPPAFFVTGLALGCGYNSKVTIPTIDEVSAFPFIQVLPTSTDPNTQLLGGPNASPLDVLNKILDPQLHDPAWVREERRSLWLAAGITFTSFELVRSQALLMVDAGSELVIALVGTSRAQFPQAGGEVVYANIELDLLIRFAPSEGVFSLQAVLAPSSFLLDRACVLTGGFAFFVWFEGDPGSEGSKHAGDFVLTLGGYNPGFKPLDYYPQPAPVGFHWTMDSTITIQGGAYFALTPAALMVGGKLQATYQSGRLKAWFDAHADVIIRWKPFWFDADIGLTIGASYTIDWGFTTSTISIEVGCELEFWGPPTGGSATIDLYVISVTIPFGTPKNNTQQVKGWHDVEQMLPNTGSKAALNVLKLSPAAGLTPDGTAPPKKSRPAGAAPDDAPSSDAAPDDAPWVVRGTMFSFSASSSIPATTASVGQTQFGGDKFNVYPLAKLDSQWSNVSSALAVKIQDASGKTDYSSSFEAVGVRGGVPSALWGSPPEDAGGNPQVPDPKNLLVPNQLTGVSVRVKAPQVGESAGSIDVQANLKFDELGLKFAVLPLSGKAGPTGDVPANSQATVSTIVRGIASEKVAGARDAIFKALRAADYAPDANDSMSKFRDGIGCTLNAEPLLVN